MATAQPPRSVLQEHLAELKSLLHLAGPVTLAFLCQIVVLITNTAFVGHVLNNTELAASGLALSFTNVCGYSIGFGLSSALDTLGSQGFGSHNRKLCGLSAQRGFIIVTIAMLPCAGLYLNAESIFLSLGIDPKVAQLAGQYSIYCIGSLPGLYYYSILEKYLQTQDIVMPSFVVSAFTAVINVPLNYVILISLNMGLPGSALVYVLGCTIAPVMLFAYVVIKKLHVETWPRWSMQSLTEWGAFFKLGLAAMAMLIIEWWSYEISQFAAGLLGTTDLDAQVITYQLVLFLFMIPMGLSDATSIHVGNLLGSGQLEQAKIAARMAVFGSCCSGLMMGTLLYFARDYVARIFTTNPAVLDKLSDVFRILAAFHVFDGIQGVEGGVLRACGRQITGAVINLLGFWVVGAPLCYVFAFHMNMGVMGIWVGLSFGCLVQVIAFTIMNLRIDWQHEVEMAKARCSESVDDGTQLSPDCEVGIPSIQKTPAVVDESDEASERAPLLISNHANHPKLKSSPLKKPLIGLTLALVMLAVGIVVWELTDTPTICFPIPDVPHSASVCGTHTSAVSGESCDVTCDDGYVPFGHLLCLDSGMFSGNVSCLRSV